MKKIYETPNIDVIELKSDSIITESSNPIGYKSSSFTFGEGTNEINF